MQKVIESEIISDYVATMQTEINLSNSYKESISKALTGLDKFTNHKPFRQITREDIISFLNSFRKPEPIDSLHKWIGTYNLYLVHLVRFFRWLHYPELPPKERPRPSCIVNIPQLRRKEKSIYKPSDMWTAEDDLLFLKYCPSKRDS
ncbi:MAG: hypothetical protein M3530_09505, partial [Thermoproteota archaeon]|nr:hypothetical protein [Thermoproteota archaeon]